MSYKKQELFTHRQPLGSRTVFRGVCVTYFLCCLVWFSSSCVVLPQCCHCFWIFHSFLRLLHIKMHENELILIIVGNFTGFSLQLWVTNWLILLKHGTIDKRCFTENEDINILKLIGNIIVAFERYICQHIIAIPKYYLSMQSLHRRCTIVLYFCFCFFYQKCSGVISF